MSTTLHCTGCGQSQHEVEVLIVLDIISRDFNLANICNECVESCNDIIKDYRTAQLQGPNRIMLYGDIYPDFN